jgi:hypothetical protein
MWPADNEIWMKSPTQMWTVGNKIGGYGSSITVLSAAQDGDWWKYVTSGGIIGEKGLSGIIYTIFFGSNISLNRAKNYAKGTLLLLNDKICLYYQNTWGYAEFKTCYVLDNLVSAYKSLIYGTNKPYATADIRPISQYPY